MTLSIIHTTSGMVADISVKEDSI